VILPGKTKRLFWGEFSLEPHAPDVTTKAEPAYRSVRTLPGFRKNLSPSVVFADEYKRLHEATWQRARSPKNPRYTGKSEQLHDYVLSMVNAGEAGKKDPDAPEEWNPS
jgi:hypothetical protein